MRRTILVMTMIAILLTTRFNNTAYGAPLIEHTVKADTLASLGLLTKGSKGYELDRPGTKLDAAVLLVRLLGKEKEALAQNLPHTYSDVPTWASPYVGYLVSQGYLQANQQTKFAPNLKFDAKSYAAMLLRGLNYRVEEGDYTSTNALDVAVKVGLLTDQEKQAILRQGFMRDEFILMSYNALKTKMKVSASSDINVNGTVNANDKRLIDSLVDSGVITGEAAVASGLADCTRYDSQLRTLLSSVTFKEVAIKDFDFSMTQDEHRLGFYYDEKNKSSLSTYYFPSHDKWSIFYTQETIVEYECYLQGKLIMSTTSSPIPIQKDDGSMTAINKTLINRPFDEVRIKVYKLTPYELSRKFQKVPVIIYKSSELSQAITAMKKASFITNSARLGDSDTGAGSVLFYCFQQLNGSLHTFPNESPFYTKLLYNKNGSTSVSNGYKMEGAIMRSAKFEVDFGKETSGFFATHFENNQPSGIYILEIAKNKDSYFLLRDANYNPTAILRILKDTSK